MSEIGATVLRPEPSEGRLFTAARRVRLGDVSPRGQARLDALARYLQDVARDDSADADFPDPMAWVVRRTLIEVSRPPQFQEDLELATWCSGFGGRWAERRTRIRGDRGGSVDAASVWVHIDAGTGAPRRLPDAFHAVWGPTAAGRRVSARLVLPSEVGAASMGIDWSVRAADLDVMGHMNNAAQWAALVEAATRFDVAGGVLTAELEHLAAIESGRKVGLRAEGSPAGVDVWLTVDGQAATVARVRALEARGASG